MSANKEHFPVIRQCGDCRVEFGINTPDASVGYCHRHTHEALTEIFSITPNWTPEKTAVMMKIMNSKPDWMYCPDMSHGVDG